MHKTVFMRHSKLLHGIASTLPGHQWQSLLPELRMLGLSHFTKTEVHRLRLHRHIAYEFTYILDGGVSWQIGEERVDIGRGEMFFTRPGEWHGGIDNMMHPCEKYWMQILIPRCGPFLGWTKEAIAGLHQGLSGRHLRHFPCSPDIVRIFTALMNEHQSPMGSLSTMAASALLTQLLIDIVRSRASAQTRETPLTPLISSALEWMHEHLGETFSVQDAAAAIGMHPSRFHDRFLKEIGQTPAEWRTRQRIAVAQTLLESPAASVTDIAHQLGFTSSQYFATAFKKYTGHTPSAYRRRPITNDMVAGELEITRRPQLPRQS